MDKAANTFQRDSAAYIEQRRMSSHLQQKVFDVNAPSQRCFLLRLLLQPE